MLATYSEPHQACALPWSPYKGVENGPYTRSSFSLVCPPIELVGQATPSDKPPTWHGYPTAGFRRCQVGDLLHRRVQALALAFDGANIWVANEGSNTVTKLRASDGAKPSSPWCKSGCVGKKC